MRRQAAHGSHVRISVSISDEKPLHMRLPSSFLLECLVSCFNLRREAAPHATQHLLGLRWSFSVVSISDEKPLHMRLMIERRYTMQLIEFQSQTRSRSTCDVKSTLMSRSPKEFQSQTRSRSTCDSEATP